MRQDRQLMPRSRIGFRDVEEIKKTTKQGVIDLFMKHIHPSSPTRSKLSIHMDSQAAPGMSREAEKEGEKEGEGEEDTTQNVATDDLASAENVKEPKAELNVAEAKIRDSNIVIEDIIEWKAGLVCSPAARPLEKLLVAEEKE